MDYRGQVTSVVSEGRFGDLIEFAYPIGFSHWGVYVGGGEVIHFAVPDEDLLTEGFRTVLQTLVPFSGDILLGRTQIRCQPIASVNVPNRAHVRINNSCHVLPWMPSPRADIQRRLDALLNKELSYDLLTLNCKHFATFVRFGHAVCNQIPRMTNKECKSATAQFQRIVTADRL